MDPSYVKDRDNCCAEGTIVDKPVNKGWVRAVVTIVLLTTALSITAAAQNSLTVSATNTMSAFPLIGDPTSSQSLTVKTSWTFSFSWAISTCIYMSTPLAGTGGNSATINQSSVRVNGSSIVSGSTGCGVPNATQIYSKWILFGANSASTTISIDIANYSPTLPPDTYSGTINLVAVAY